ncbi:MAG: hypothetical protein NTY38_31755 [Acidobacteria bacterium]|nr:hypothetical protein [Acidobacteriota bacterium]
MRWIRNSALLPAAVLLLLAAAPGKAGDSPFANVSRRVFADLLKIPLEAPAVSATVDSSREEDGLIIEDVSWPSIDNDRVQAYVVRPAKAAGRLPAIVCLHGSSTNRDVRNMSMASGPAMARTARDTLCSDGPGNSPVTVTSRWP